MIASQRPSLKSAGQSQTGCPLPPRAILRQWLEEHVLPAFAGRVLPFDLPAARILATYPVPDQAPLDDALVAAIAAIAAIAQSNAMTIATRNTRRFEPLGVSIVNPWNHPE